MVQRKAQTTVPQGHKTTSKNTQDSYETLVKYVSLGAEIFKNMTLSMLGCICP